MKHLIIGFMAFLLMFPAPAEAGRKKKKAKPQATQEASKKEKGPFKDFAEITKDAEGREGFFDTYTKDENLYLLIPESRLNEEFLLVTELAEGIGTEGLNGGSMIDWEGRVVALERHGDTVYLVQKPVRYFAGNDEATANALSYSIGDSVLESAKIVSIKKAEEPKSGEATTEGADPDASGEKAGGEDTLVIDIYSWVVSDLADVGEAVQYAVSEVRGKPAAASFDKSRSYLQAVKSFPKNLNVKVKLTFRPSKPKNFPSVPDDRYLPFSVYYVFAALPEEPMVPRLADSRIGLFMTVRKDFSATDQSDFFVRYARRWRLEPGEKVGNLYRPKKPIVYYLDRSIPEDYRDVMKEGVEAWNDAFEAAGFKDAIKAEMLPEDADPEDIRYPTLRWITSDDPSYGAIGPSVVDPRTGEILDADILFEANILMRFGRTWRELGQPEKAIEEMFTLPENEARSIGLGGEHRSFYAELGAQGGLLRSMLMARGDIGFGEAVPREYLDEAMKWVTMHEVGHTLGLYHNFRSSIDTPVDKLHDKAWVKAHGLYGSVMDYPTINLAANGRPNGYYYTPVVGTADKWTISYGYTPDPEKAAEIARQGAKPGHAYGNDLDARGAAALDPHTSVYDLGSDPLAWGRDRVAMIEELWQRLPEFAIGDNAPYEDLTRSFQTALFQYSRALAPAIKYIGGQYTYRDYYGDPGGRGPFQPVSKEKQLEALSYLTENGFSRDAFSVPAEVLSKFGARAYSHWGNDPNYSEDGRRDYPYHGIILNIQESILNQLTSPQRLAMIRDAELKYGADQVLGIPELMGAMTEAVWSEIWEKPGENISASRRDLQRAHLDRMVAVLTDSPSNMPSDARSVTRSQLRDLQGRIGGRLKPPAFDFDAYSRAHLEEVQDRIEKALEAGLEVEGKK